MKIKDQVCNFEQAKQLKTLGVKQDSIFSWYNSTDREDTPGLNSSRQYDCPTCGHPNTPYFEESSAFTVAELGIMLPHGCDTFYCLGKDEGWHAFDLGITHMKAFKTEAEARAALLIHLLKTNTITADEVNKRLTNEID